MDRKRWMVAGGVAASAAAWYLYAKSRVGAKRIPYIVAKRDGAFELRDYPPLHAAVVREQNDEESLRLLLQYIDRGNVAKKKIAMTTPFLIDREPGRSAMAFVMPPGSAVPDPLDERVSIASRVGGRVAAMRFFGDEQRAIEELRREVAARNLEPYGDPVVAYYGALHRKEVMLRLK